jgi:hypothetical protein
MLNSIRQLSHQRTEVWLCVQERCPHAHKKLRGELPNFFEVSDMPLDNLPGLQFASELECMLMRMVVKQGVTVGMGREQLTEKRAEKCAEKRRKVTTIKIKKRTKRR